MTDLLWNEIWKVDISSPGDVTHGIHMVTYTYQVVVWDAIRHFEKNWKSIEKSIFFEKKVHFSSSLLTLCVILNFWHSTAKLSAWDGLMMPRKENYGIGLRGRKKSWTVFINKENEGSKRLSYHDHFFEMYPRNPNDDMGPDISWEFMGQNPKGGHEILLKRGRVIQYYPRILS